MRDGMLDRTALAVGAPFGKQGGVDRGGSGGDFPHESRATALSLWAGALKSIGWPFIVSSPLFRGLTSVWEEQTIDDEKQMT